MIRGQTSRYISAAALCASGGLLRQPNDPEKKNVFHNSVTRWRSHWSRAVGAWTQRFRVAQCESPNRALSVDRTTLIRSTGSSFEECYEQTKQDLGAGAFGSVSKVVHKITKTKYAAKRIPKAVLTENWSMFLNEVNNLIELDHPHIIKLVEYFDCEKDMILIFELCEGPDLFDKVFEIATSRQPGKPLFKEWEAARILRHMLKAIWCCHANGIVHRDIKPENFMFKTKDALNLKMIDLGLSMHYDQGTKVEGQTGTILYMAPEMFTGTPYNHKCDIWACGVVLFMLLSGEMLFPDEGAITMDLIADPKYLEGRLNRLEGVSKGAKTFLHKLLQHDPKDRPSAQVCLSHSFIQKSYALEPVHHDVSGKKTLFLNLVENMQRYAKMPFFKRFACTVLVHMVGTESELTKSLRMAFRMLDRGGRGSLTYDELVSGLKFYGIPIPDNFSTIWPKVDLNLNDELSFTEFMSCAMHLDTFVKSDLYLQGVFSAIDADHTGVINIEDLTALLPNHSTQSLEAMMHEVTPSGRFTLDEFKVMMKKAV